MSLLEQQRRFQAAILAPEPRPVADVAANSLRGMPVYRHAYRATLRSALADTFERTHAWLGDNLFQAAADRLIAEHGSASWTLSVYGAGFPATLAALHPGDPEIAELARLDWALRRAFDAADGGSPDPARLAAADWEHARFAFHPAVATIAIRTNSPAIWSAIAAGETPPAVALLPYVGWVRVWRQGLSPTFRSIEPVEANALGWARDGLALGAICARLEVEGHADVATLAGTLLADWLRDGIVANVEEQAPS